jgi:hypothetical protein
MVQLCASNSELQIDPILKHTFDDDSSSCIQVNTVVPTQPYTAGQMIFLIVQTTIESICFDLCMCVLLLSLITVISGLILLNRGLNFGKRRSHRARFMDMGGGGGVVGNILAVYDWKFLHI